MNNSIHCPLALFQGKNFILGRKPLWRNELKAIFVTWIFRPHIGLHAAIVSKKPRETRRKQGVEKIWTVTYAFDL
jgi:hypothetical protein